MSASSILGSLGSIEANEAGTSKPVPHARATSLRYLYDHPSETSQDEVELKDGSVVDRYSSPVIDRDRKYYGRIWTFRDITARKRTEDALRMLSSAVEQSPVSVLITDPQGRIVYVNRKFTQCSGYDFEEVLGRNPRMLKSGDTSAAEYKNLWGTITQGMEWRGEFHNRRKNGELYWESVLITPLRDAQGSIAHFLAVKEDTTERKMLDSQLQQARKLEAVGQLAAGVAHEINTPTQYIGDNVRFLKKIWPALGELLVLCQAIRRESAEGPVSLETVAQLLQCSEEAGLDSILREVPRAIDGSLEGVQRVSGIVRAMKEFSHPGSQEKHAIDINHAIETTIAVARNEWKYVAEVRTRFDTSLPPVPCFAAEFNQVILNLVINAAHAIGDAVQNSPQCKGIITVTTTQDEDWVEVKVQDTGAGIPQEIRRRIFEPFFTTKAAGKGTGQGLALAYSVVVKKHNGHIWFESEVGKGTTFVVRLPLSSSAQTQ